MESDLQASLSVTIVFTSQKNRVRYNNTGHKESGYPTLCPKVSLLRKTLFFCDNAALLSTPLHHVMMPDGSWISISPQMIPKTLRTSVKFCGPELVFEDKGVYAHSLHAAGTMELLCVGIDSDIVNIIVQWHSNEMLCYLRIQADLATSNFLSLVISHGKYSFMSHQKAPCF